MAPVYPFGYLPVKVHTGGPSPRGALHPCRSTPRPHRLRRHSRRGLRSAGPRSRPRTEPTAQLPTHLPSRSRHAPPWRSPRAPPVDCRAAIACRARSAAPRDACGRAEAPQARRAVTRATGRDRPTNSGRAFVTRPVRCGWTRRDRASSSAGRSAATDPAGVRDAVTSWPSTSTAPGRRVRVETCRAARRRLAIVRSSPIGIRPSATPRSCSTLMRRRAVGRRSRRGGPWSGLLDRRRRQPEHAPPPWCLEWQRWMRRRDGRDDHLGVRRETAGRARPLGCSPDGQGLRRGSGRRGGRGGARAAGAGPQPPRAELRKGVFGSTARRPEPHFLGWDDEVDQDALFDAGEAWGLSVRLVAAA